MALKILRESSFCDKLQNSAILQALYDQRNTSTFCDVVMKVCGREICAHSNVLSAASPYFKTFLGADLPRQFSQKTPQVIEIHIEGSEPSSPYEDAVESIIDFIYLGILNVNLLNCKQILEIAEIMQMKAIVKFCNEFLLDLRGKEVGTSTELILSDSLNCKQTIHGYEDKATTTSDLPSHSNFEKDIFVNKPTVSKSIHDGPTFSFQDEQITESVLAQTHTNSLELISPTHLQLLQNRTWQSRLNKDKNKLISVGVQVVPQSFQNGSEKAKLHDVGTSTELWPSARLKAVYENRTEKSLSKYTLEKVADVSVETTKDDMIVVAEDTDVEFNAEEESPHIAQLPCEDKHQEATKIQSTECDMSDEPPAKVRRIDAAAAKRTRSGRKVTPTAKMQGFSKKQHKKITDKDSKLGEDDKVDEKHKDSKPFKTRVFSKVQLKSFKTVEKDSESDSVDRVEMVADENNQLQNETKDALVFSENTIDTEAEDSPMKNVPVNTVSEDSPIKNVSMDTVSEDSPLRNVLSSDISPIVNQPIVIIPQDSNEQSESQNETETEKMDTSGVGSENILETDGKTDIEKSSSDIPIIEIAIDPESLEPEAFEENDNVQEVEIEKEEKSQINTPASVKKKRVRKSNVSKPKSTNELIMDVKPTVGKYQCDQCDFMTNKVREMSRHRRSHKLENDMCPYCDLQLADKESLRMHIDLHKGPKPFWCRHCDETFKSRTMLNLHLPKHTDEKTFICEVCSMGFKWKHALKSHMITHSFHKEHLCSVCGYATAYKTQMKAHMLIHTGNTLKCPEQGCTFEATKKQNMKYHMLTHTQEKPHICDLCGQRFSLLKNMKRHQLLHTNTKTQKCHLCTFSSTRFDKLKEHMFKSHGAGTAPEKKQKMTDFMKEVVLTPSTVPMVNIKQEADGMVQIQYVEVSGERAVADVSQINMDNVAQLSEEASMQIIESTDFSIPQPTHTVHVPNMSSAKPGGKRKAGNKSTNQSKVGLEAAHSSSAFINKVGASESESIITASNTSSIDSSLLNITSIPHTSVSTIQNLVSTDASISATPVTSVAQPGTVSTFLVSTLADDGSTILLPAELIQDGEGSGNLISAASLQGYEDNAASLDTLQNNEQFSSQFSDIISNPDQLVQFVTTSLAQ